MISLRFVRKGPRRIPLENSFECSLACWSSEAVVIQPESSKMGGKPRKSNKETALFFDSPPNRKTSVNKKLKTNETKWSSLCCGVPPKEMGTISFRWLRRKGEILGSNLVGWVTVKGNAGTATRRPLRKGRAWKWEGGGWCWMGARWVCFSANWFEEFEENQGLVHPGWQKELFAMKFSKHPDISMPLLRSSLSLARSITSLGIRSFALTLAALARPSPYWWSVVCRKSLRSNHSQAQRCNKHLQSPLTTMSNKPHTQTQMCHIKWSCCFL